MHAPTEEKSLEERRVRSLRRTKEQQIKLIMRIQKIGNQTAFLTSIRKEEWMQALIIFC